MKKMSKPVEIGRAILPDTSLCAIVRDEMINPAQLPGKSGIRSFVESHVPYVEKAVIVDTGSIDGTRQELEQLASEFPNLRVYDRPFDDYASARNHSLNLVKTKMALVLDVDELISNNSFGKINEILDIPEKSYLFPSQVPHFFHFFFTNITYRGERLEAGGFHIRMGVAHKIIFRNQAKAHGEYPYTIGGPVISNFSPNVLKTGLEIFHFEPGEKYEIRPGEDMTALHYKRDHWYYSGNGFQSPPSQSKHFSKWKRPNPHRVKFE